MFTCDKLEHEAIGVKQGYIVGPFLFITCFTAWRLSVPVFNSSYTLACINEYVHRKKQTTTRTTRNTSVPVRTKYARESGDESVCNGDREICTEGLASNTPVWRVSHGTVMGKNSEHGN